MLKDKKVQIVLAFASMVVIGLVISVWGEIERRSYCTNYTNDNWGHAECNSINGTKSNTIGCWNYTHYVKYCDIENNG